MTGGNCLFKGLSLSLGEIIRMAASCYVFFIFEILFYLRTAQAGGLVYGLKNGMVIMSPDFPGNMDEITWKFKEDKVAELNGDNIEYYGIFKSKVILYKNNGSLELKNLQAQDSGTYEVEIVQNGRINNDMFNLRVIDPVPKPVIECNVTNEHVMLTCKTEINSLTRLQWNGTDIKNQENTANPLVLEKRDDNAEFTCTASNPVSEMKSDIFLIKDCNGESNLLNVALLAVVVVVLILLLLSIIAIGLYFYLKNKVSNDTKQDKDTRHSENLKLMSGIEMETNDKETDKLNLNQCTGSVGEHERIEDVIIYKQSTDPDNAEEDQDDMLQDTSPDSNKALAPPAQQTGEEENDSDSNKALEPAAQQTHKEENDSDNVEEMLDLGPQDIFTDCNEAIVLPAEQTGKTENESGKVTNPETLNNEENITKAGDTGSLEASAEHAANDVKESGSANNDKNKEVKSQDEDQVAKPELLKNEGNNTKTGSLEVSAENAENVKESDDTGPLDVSTEEADNNNKELDKKEDV
ncbi:uncharacterized protein LOC114650837 isoform X2 [Erpetoichthys calabaricus]|uniref:uncharacterized protein LOC114650837 isoform X2 n=1 Tax=Erpetoichthys calabaricus TaxID=27687 RepID=UPI002234599E|nr:uncharacterized protein LOC114650837 isoform X2 [Erpetoichthys calabaricus]